MIKLTFCLKRNPDMTREEFQKYWRENHAPLVASVAETLRIRRYVQTHSLPSDVNVGLQRSRGGPEEYDGVAELWWDSLADINRDEPAARAAGRMLLEDERKFIDLANSPLWLSEEYEVVNR
ncbi:ethyl tert-butyl ether degradation protein EthD [bacterium SCGC AG-212-C10]|nr:ethyl tert-butyl ether degradation protein EthD [bacterium SCGC AG-212-C10]